LAENISDGLYAKRKINILIFSTIKKYKIVTVVLIILLSLTLTSCIGEPKYNYEEYKKLKATDTDKGSEAITEDLLVDDDVGNDELESYSRDLDDYCSYMEEFKSVCNKYTNELFTLFDDFDNEEEDIDKKNLYANLILEYEEKWITDLEEIKVPDFLEDYHIYFIDFLNNEVLFYKYFIEGDLEKANSLRQEPDNAYGNSLIELEAVEEGFNNRAEKLNLERPF